MKRVFFIGQAMPRVKEDPHDWKSLNAWLYQIKITDSEIKKYFYFSALVDYFPGVENGSHRVPSKEEISKESARLKNLLLGFDPEIVIPVGRLSISYCLNLQFSKLSDVIGKKYYANPYLALNAEIPIIPFPHPSGASTWRYKKGNLVLLQNALQLLKSELK